MREKHSHAQNERKTQRKHTHTCEKNKKHKKKRRHACEMIKHTHMCETSEKHKTTQKYFSLVSHVCVSFFLFYHYVLYFSLVSHVCVFFARFAPMCVFRPFRTCVSVCVCVFLVLFVGFTRVHLFILSLFFVSFTYFPRMRVFRSFRMCVFFHSFRTCACSSLMYVFFASFAHVRVFFLCFFPFCTCMCVLCVFR